MRFLKPGGTIAIVAPSGALATQPLARGIYQLRAAGYKVKIMPHVCGCAHSVFSAPDEDRAADLAAALADPEVDTVWCVRGGYGAVRTLQHLDTQIFAQTDKVVVGFSDITALHSAAVRAGHFGLQGPMLKHIAVHGLDAPDVRATFEILGGHTVSYHMPAGPDSRDGDASGVLVGGNLSIIYSLRNTPADIDFDGKILFFEDLCEYRYHIDRMVQNLKYSGAFDNLAGLIVGQMTELKDGATPFGKNAYEIVAEAVADKDYPVWMGFPAGHEDDINFPLIFGAEVYMSVDDGLGKFQQTLNPQSSFWNHYAGEF